MKRLVILVLAGLCVVGSVFAQVVDFSTLRGKYEAARAKIEADCGKAKDAAKTEYGNALVAAMVALKAKGNLDGYLAVEKAKKQFDADGRVPEEGNGAVRAYRETVKKADADALAKTYTLNKNYANYLEPFIKQLMQADKIDDAKQVKEELNRIKFEMADAETKQPKADGPKPEEKPVGMTVVSSLLLSTTDKVENGYDLVAQWATDNTGGVATDGKDTHGSMYLFVKKEAAAEAVTDVVLYNAGSGNVTKVGTPDGYESLGYWDVQSSVDGFGTANQWNVSLCVKKGTKKPVVDVVLGTDSGLQRKGYVKRGVFNGMTLWVKYGRF